MPTGRIIIITSFCVLQLVVHVVESYPVSPAGTIMMQSTKQCSIELTVIDLFLSLYTTTMVNQHSHYKTL